jgi:hypothetical protein
VTVWLWCSTCAYISQNIDGNGLASRVLHLLTPYTAFLETNSESNAGPTLVTSFTGSPLWFLVWTVALCGLAATVALLHGAEGAVRRTVLRWFTASAVVAVVALVLGLTTGAQQLVQYTPDGASRVVPTQSDG